MHIVSVSSRDKAAMNIILARSILGLEIEGAAATSFGATS